MLKQTYKANFSPPVVMLGLTVCQNGQDYDYPVAPPMLLTKRQRFGEKKLSKIWQQNELKLWQPLLLDEPNSAEGLT
jgi:hypothetical protein